MFSAGLEEEYSPRTGCWIFLAALLVEMRTVLVNLSVHEHIDNLLRLSCWGWSVRNMRCRTNQQPVLAVDEALQSLRIFVFAWSFWPNISPKSIKTWRHYHHCNTPWPRYFKYAIWGHPQMSRIGVPYWLSVGPTNNGRNLPAANRFNQHLTSQSAKSSRSLI